MVTMYKLLFTSKAKQQYEKMNQRMQKQIDKGLERILMNPKSGKPLRGELKGIWLERVATFRILYKIYETEIKVLILLIEHRKTVYGGH